MIGRNKQYDHSVWKLFCVKWFSLCSHLFLCTCFIFPKSLKINKNSLCFMALFTFVFVCLSLKILLHFRISQGMNLATFYGKIHNSHLKIGIGQFILETNMSDCRPRTQSQGYPNFMRIFWKQNKEKENHQSTNFSNTIIETSGRQLQKWGYHCYSYWCSVMTFPV